MPQMAFWNRTRALCTYDEYHDETTTPHDPDPKSAAGQRVINTAQRATQRHEQKKGQRGGFGNGVGRKST